MAVESGIGRAIAYLLGQQTRPGRWEDFDTLAGTSTQWVSAYVGLALARTGDPRALPAARAAWSRLRRRRWRSAGWAYNGKVPADADSTLWAMHLAEALGEHAGRRAQRFLGRHLTPEGALATFAEAGPIRVFTKLQGHSFAGWCGPHTCVTAAGAGLASLPGRDRALDYLRAAQRPDGDWSAYWWESPYYATTLAAEALAAAADEPRVHRAARWAARAVEAWGDAPASPFDRALALRALLLIPETRPEADRVLDALLRDQRSDGSWTPSARLRIPPPQVTEPETYPAWVEGGRGGGSVQADPRACFTTATVLQALCAAERRAGLPSATRGRAPARS